MQGLQSVHDTFSFSAIEPLVATVKKHANDLLLVLVAFDGVLAEYGDDPVTVRLSSERRELLRRLIRQPGVALGVLSGRRVQDLRERVGLGDDVFYVGLHGLEAVGPGFTRIERHLMDEFRDALHEIVSVLEPAISETEGARLEDKEAAIALHTRQADPGAAVWARFQMLNRAVDLLNTQVLRALRGNHVLELVPNVGHAKAEAITAIREYLLRRDGRPVFTLYVGEDVSDDDAFEAIAGHGITAAVGRRGEQAHYRLPSIEVVEQLLAELATARGQD